MDRCGTAGPVVAAPGGLAVNSRKRRAIGPGVTHPGRDGCLEQRGIDPVHQDNPPASARNAMLTGQMTAQAVQMRLPQAAISLSSSQSAMLARTTRKKISASG